MAVDEAKLSDFLGQLAERTGTSPRYVTERLAAQAASAYVTVAGHGRFTLNAEQAFALSDPDGPLYVPGALLLALASFKAEPPISEAFRTGAGLAWHEQDSEVFDGCEQFFAPGYRASLVQSWIPALDGAEAKLRAGAKVADIGCMDGASSRIMAEAFPASSLTGYDYHSRSIEQASKAAADAGLGDRVRFAVAPADGFPGADYDLITAFDCLHDTGHPAAAARHIRQALAEDGTWLLVKPAAADDLAGNLNPVGRVYYAFSTLLCVPSALAQEPAVVLGNQAGGGPDAGDHHRGGIHPAPPGRTDPVQPRVRSASLMTAPATPGELAGSRLRSAAAGTLVLPGARLAYELAGDGPAVVLVHGFGLDMRMWDPQVEQLAARFRVLRYDCRGFGASGPFDPAVPYTHAGDLVALLDHLAIPDAVLAGLSFGGRVVLQAALAAPARVRGLVLLDAVLDGVPWDPESVSALDEAAQQAQDRGLLAGRAAWLRHPLFATAHSRPAVASQLAAMVASYPGQHWLGRDPHQPVWSQPIDALEDLTMPVLVLVGEHDVPGFREMSAVLARRIRGARYHAIANAGHMVSMEQPAAVNELLGSFLDQLPPETAEPESGAPGAGLSPSPGRPR